MKVGTIYILDEDDAMEKAKERSSEFIVNVAQEAMECITEKGDEDHVCNADDEIHVKAWSTYSRS